MLLLIGLSIIQSSYLDNGFTKFKVLNLKGYIIFFFFFNFQFHKYVRISRCSKIPLKCFDYFLHCSTTTEKYETNGTKY